MAEEGGDTPVTREELKEPLEELLRESPVFNQILAAAEAGVAAAGAPGTASASEGAGEATAGDGANNSKLPRQYSSRTSLEGCACVAVAIGEGEVVSCRQSHRRSGAGKRKGKGSWVGIQNISLKSNSNNSSFYHRESLGSPPLAVHSLPKMNRSFIKSQ